MTVGLGVRRRPRVRRTVRRAWADRVASDPGLLRLRLAGRATLAVALSSAVLHPLGPTLGLPSVVAMLIGGMVGVNGSFASSSRAPRDAALTLAVLPVVAAVGALPAALAAGHTVIHLVGFVVVMVAAVYVRRFGPRWFNWGMFAWIAYFFTTFIGITLRTLPALLAVVAVGTACLVLVAAVLLPDRPAAVRAAARRSFVARIAALAQTAHDVVTGAVEPHQAPGRLHARCFRLVEVSLILDGYFADVPDATAVRRVLLDAELAAEELAGAVTDLPVARLPAPVRGGLATALQELADGRHGPARQEAERVRARLEQDVPDDLSGLVRDVTDAVDRLVELQDRPLPQPPAHTGDYSPAVQLYLGNLPGSAATANGVLSGSALGWSLNTRLCVQTAIAAPIAIALGYALSAQRYYWAVLACFLVLTGTLTTGEATTKAVNRVLGTLGGLVAATVAVHLTGDSDAGVFAVMLGATFLGLYFFRVSYALMAFAVTTIMGELYDVLREFSDGLLLLRVAETVIGASAAVAVVLVVLPLRTIDARATAQTAFLSQLAALLADLRDRLAEPGRTSNLIYDTRLLDAQLHQLALVTRPHGGPTLTGLGTRSALRGISGYTALAHRARSLAAAVTAVEPGSLPELAQRVEALRLRCLGQAAASPPDRSCGTGPVTRRVDELDEALTTLLGFRERAAREHPALA